VRSGKDGEVPAPRGRARALAAAALVAAALVDAALVDAALVDAALVDAALVDAALVAVVWPRDDARRPLRMNARAAGPRAPLDAPDAPKRTAPPGRGSEASAPEEDIAVAGSVLPESLDELIRDLADDDERDNATRAMPELVALGAAAVPALLRALDSPDRQQRQLAAAVLRRIDGLTPSRRLLEVTVEGLGHDGIPDNRMPYVFNAAEGADYLARHVDAAADALVRALDSDDAQQRFLAAYVIARTGRTWALARTCGLLIEHLEDNDVPNDASLACQALFGLGAPALPYLREQAESPEPQQRRLAMRLADDIRGAPAGPSRARDVVYAPGARQRILHVLDIASRHRWMLLRRVRHGVVPVPPLRALRREHGAALVFRTAAHAARWSVLEVSTDSSPRLLVLRVHDNGHVERRNESNDGPRWLPVR